MTYEGNSLRIATGNFWRLNRGLKRAIREFATLIRESRFWVVRAFAALISDWKGCICEAYWRLSSTAHIGRSFRRMADQLVRSGDRILTKNTEQKSLGDLLGGSQPIASGMRVVVEFAGDRYGLVDASIHRHRTGRWTKRLAYPRP